MCRRSENSKNPSAAILGYRKHRGYGQIHDILSGSPVPSIYVSMSSPSVFVDLPFSLQQELYSVWLGGINDRIGKSYVKSLLKLDSALCNKQMRPLLHEIYQTIDFENFFFMFTYSNLNATHKMKWAIARKVSFPRLALNCIEIDVNTLKAFFRIYGANLKAIKLMNFHGAMTELTKFIAVECKSLEILVLERCNLTLPIANILNKSTTIREVRLQKRLFKKDIYKIVQSIAIVPKVCKHLFEKIHCPSVVKLALVDQVHIDDVPAITRAFPNVTDLELQVPSPEVLTGVFSVWKSIQVLRVVGMSEHAPLTPNMLTPVADMCSQLTKIIISSAQYQHFPASAFEQVLSKCTRLESVALETNEISNGTDLLVSIAVTLNSRLLELQVGRISVNADAVLAIAEHCTNLRVLNMHSLTRHAKYVEVLRTCPLQKLRVALWMAGPRQLQFLAHIAEHCSQLEVLSFGHETLPEQAIMHIVAKCKALRVVEVRGSNTRAWHSHVRAGVKIIGDHDYAVGHNRVKDYDF